MVSERLWRKIQADFLAMKGKILVLEKTIDQPNNLITNSSEMEQGSVVVLAMINDLQNLNKNLIKARSDILLEKGRI